MIALLGLFGSALGRRVLLVAAIVLGLLGTYAAIRHSGERAERARNTQHMEDALERSRQADADVARQSDDVVLRELQRDYGRR